MKNTGINRLAGPAARKDEKAFALVITLWSIAMLSIMAASFAVSHGSEAVIARNDIDALQARHAADAGIYRALQTFGRRDTRTDDPPGFERLETGNDGDITGAPVAARLYRWRLNNKEIFIIFQNEDGKININGAPAAVLERLFESAGAENSAQLAAAVVDFRDRDDTAQPGGAEAAEYEAAGLAYGPKNAPFAAVVEITQVIGMTDPVYARISGMLSVYAAQRGVDVDVASAAVVAAVSSDRVFAFNRGERRRAGGADADEFVARSRNRVFTVRAQAMIESGAQFTREAIVDFGGGRASRPEILSWRRGPAIITQRGDGR